MNYSESRAYVEEAGKYGSVLGLGNMYEMMRRLGNPQDDLSIIHVAGTNGKGSVIAYLYTVLTGAGYRVGRYTSPTLYSYRERLEVSGVKITREEFADCITEVSRAIEDMTRAGLPHPTTFEIETAAAFVYFARRQCDLVLLEVGMGGNLDATNILKKPVLSVLTSISMDHMAFLGNTLGEIAEKKAGILKPGSHMVTAVQEPEVQAVLKTRCGQLGIDFCQAEEPLLTKESIRGQEFLLNGRSYRIALAGACQKYNAALALKALEVLHTLGYETTWEQRQDGLLKTIWNGRFTVLREEPLFIVDGAHNPGAADMLASSIRRYFGEKRPDRKMIFIIGMFKDKDYEGVLVRTAGFADTIFTIQTPDNDRALPAGELAKAAARYCGDVRPCAQIAEAIEGAFAEAGRDDIILSYGSLSCIGEITAQVKKISE